jgi:hypothetical protein
MASNSLLHWVLATYMFGIHPLMHHAQKQSSAGQRHLCRQELWGCKRILTGSRDQDRLQRYHHGEVGGKRIVDPVLLFTGFSPGT